MLDVLYKNLIKYKEDLDNWFNKMYDENNLPFYGSVDVRYSGWKVSVVDANYFPAGFNNLDIDFNTELAIHFKNYINSKYEGILHIHIFPESHTRNVGYIENILRLKKIGSLAGYSISVGSPLLNGFDLLEGHSDDLLLDKVIINRDGFLEIDGKVPDLILLNNDLTGGLLPGLKGVVEPPVEMGWFERKKSNHYLILETLVNEVSKIIKIDPWFLFPKWFVSEDKCLESDNCINKLSADIDLMLSRIKEKYDEYGIDSKPLVFVKNNKGTYGLGIISLTSGNEIKNLSKRKIRRLTYGKGGSSTEDFIIQEGIPTSIVDQSNIIEPVGYTIGGKESFWFLRSNNQKSVVENLNSPSSKFLQFNELSFNLSDPMYVEWFNLVSKLSYLAMGIESVKS